MAIIGYIRVSSKKQTYEHQLHEIERNLISQQTKASLDNIKSMGKKLGRPFSAQSKKLKLSKNTKKIRKLLDMGLTRYRIAKIMNVKQTTLSRFISRMGWST